MLSLTSLTTRFLTRTTFLSAALLITGLLPQYAYAHGMSEADKLAIIEGGNLAYLWQGMTHMLTGYDHLAFVFGIIFFLRTLRDIVKYVTAFTLGHSVTLIYATFNAIQLNYFVIDAVIGLSVCYIAFANLDGFRKFFGINPPNMLVMIVVLGLIHGFGLSTRLQELPLSEDSLLLNIISFNVGIELGQVSALTLMLILMAAWRRSNAFLTFSLAANYTLILAGSLLFAMQVYGYAHSRNSESVTVSAEPSQKIVVNKEAPPAVKPSEKAPPKTPVEASPRKAPPKEFPEEPPLSRWKNTISVTIPARGDKEYKLYLAKGATFEYSWETNGEALFFDFHGEPAGDTTGYFKSFKKSTESRSSGSLTTVFEGPHGWYWRNKTPLPVTITLKAKGDYKRLD